MNELPSEIIGSMVKQWPAFITPTALFSRNRFNDDVHYNQFDIKTAATH